MRHIIIAAACFLLTGCITPHLFSDNELAAWNQMARAAEKEKSSDFQAAITAYAGIAGTYPGTSCHKPAVWRAAILNLHPDNPGISYTAAQEWLDLYLTLPLSSTEKETADILTAFIRQKKKDMDEKNRLSAVIDHQKKIRKNLVQELKQSRARTAAAKKKLEIIKTYEKELSLLRDKLERMKEIDIQVHNTKKQQ